MLLCKENNNNKKHMEIIKLSDTTIGIPQAPIEKTKDELVVEKTNYENVIAYHTNEIAKYTPLLEKTEEYIAEATAYGLKTIEEVEAEVVETVVVEEVAEEVMV